MAEQKSDFVNVTAKYSDIVDVRFYIYRGPVIPHHLIKEISVGTNRGVINIRNPRAQRQFLEKLELPFLETRQIEDWKERDKALMDALKKRREREQKGEVYPLVFRCKVEGNNRYAWSVVTTEYQEVPVYEARSMFEAAVRNENLLPWQITEWQDSGIHFYRYKILERDGRPLASRFANEQADFCMLLRVGFAGDRAISIVPSWSLQTLLSKHYITARKSTRVFRAVHRYKNKDEILSDMNKSVKVVLGQLSLLQEPEVAMTISYERFLDIYKGICVKYPQHIQSELERSWLRHFNTENGHVRMTLALSDVASNYENLSTSQRLSLEQDAFRVLELC